jgi:hypothetical protein
VRTVVEVVDVEDVVEVEWFVVCGTVEVSRTVVVKCAVVGWTVEVE